jgi:hypothetical protein
MTTENPVLSKIRKLLALADAARNSSEAEAQAAALKVQELLAAHNLTLSEVEQAGGTSDDGARGVVQADRRAMYKWQVDLMAKLADNNFCMHRVSEVEAHDGRKVRRSKQHVLVGRELNVQVTVATYDYLSEAVKRAANEHGYAHAADTEKDHHIFLSGAVDRLCERLTERRRQQEREQQAAREAARAAGGQVNALVLTDVYGSEHDLNLDAMNHLPPGTTAQKRRDAEAKERARQAYEAQMVKDGVEPTEAFYRSHGYSVEHSVAYAARYNRNQRTASRRASRARGYSQSFRQTRRDSKYDTAAYRDGVKAGGTIGIDTQVSKSSTKVLK